MFDPTMFPVKRSLCLSKDERSQKRVRVWSSHGDERQAYYQLGDAELPGYGAADLTKMSEPFMRRKRPKRRNTVVNMANLIKAKRLKNKKPPEIVPLVKKGA